MARVVVVHGIGQEFKGPESMKPAVEASLRDGVRLAGFDPSVVGEVECAFYGDLFTAPGTRAGDIPLWDETDVDEGLEIQLLEAWWSAAANIEPGWVQAPDERASRGVGYGMSRLLVSRRVRAALDALAGSSFFERISDRVLIFGLKQVSRYLTESSVRSAVRDRVAAAVASDTRVIVGHSLGSVVAYEALCVHPEWPIAGFVTLGSPLGMRSVVFDRLDPEPEAGVGAWPGQVARWSNIADPADVVALPAQLAGRFGTGQVRDLEVRNGARMHDLSRYLTAPKTGTAIAEALSDVRALP